MRNRIYKYKILILTCLWLTVGAASAAAQDGTAAYTLLNIPSSSKIYGLGGVNISLVDEDMSSADQNPALLGPEMTNQVNLSYMRYLGSANFAGVGYTRAIGERGAWSAGVRYYGFGSMQHTDNMGNVLGTFSASDAVFNAAMSYNIGERLRGGIRLNLITSSYAQYSALALGTDLGLNYYNPDNDMSLSMTAVNLGGQIKRFNEQADRLPTDVRLGWSQTFGSFPVRFSVTAWNLTKWHLPYYDNNTTMNEPQLRDTFGSNLMRHLVFGADLISSQRYYLGLGYNYKTRTDMSTYQRNLISGWSLCGGMNVGDFAFGIALAQPHSGATTLMLNMTLNLNTLL